MKSKFCNNFKENDYISEKELIDIFKIQYNDIFHNILKYDQNKIMILLQEQVYLHLRLINKIIDYSLIQKTLSLFLNQYLEDKEKVYNTYQIIKNYPNQLIYLDYLNCFIHCTKCKNALHKCGHNFIVYNDYVFCLSCKEVYNEFQVHMYCKECNEEYFTKLREIKIDSQANFFPAAYEKYHCHTLDFDEIIRCTQCKSYLYIDINSNKNNNKIKEIFCQNCKKIYDVTNMSYTCIFCNCNFKSDVKIYNFFQPLKIDLLCVIHSLNINKFALPFIIANKYCRCDLSKIEMLKHNDGGDLLEGDRFDKKVVVCNKCFGVFNMDNFDWACPICKKGFGIKKISIFEYRNKEINSKYKNQYYTSMSNFQKINNFFSKNLREKKNEKNLKNKSNYSNYNYLSNNNSSKKNNINNLSNNSMNNNNSRVNHKNCKCIKNNNIMMHKPSKSINYSAQKENYLRTEIKENSRLYSKLNTKLNTRIHSKEKKIKNIRNETSHKKNSTKRIGDNYISNFNRRANHSIEKQSNSYYYKRASTNFLRISFDDKLNNRNLYDKSNKYKKNDDIKKNLFFEKDSKDDNQIHIQLRKNYSEKNNIVRKRIIENNMYTTRSIFSNDKENKMNQTSNNYKNNYSKSNSKNNSIKNNFNQSCKNDRRVNHIKKINIINISKKLNTKKPINNNKRNLNRNINKIININKNFLTEYNNSRNNININIKIKNTNNNIFKVKSNYFQNNSNIKKLNNINKNFNYINKMNNKSIKNNNVRKNDIHIITNMNKSIKDKINISQRKNHVHIISCLNESNSTSNVKNNSKRKKNNIHLVTTMNEINSNLCKSQMSKSKIQKKISKTAKKFKKEKENSESFNKINQFHSDDYNIIKSIGEGTFGKIYLVRNSKSKEIFALKQISLKDKKDLNNNKGEFEFLMKLTEENPNLNIIKILGIEVKRLDKFNVVLYVLMEAGKCDWEKEIHQRNKEKRFYKEEELINILTSLVNTFSILQEKGISHRDVKPQNIVYFTEDIYKNKNVYKITDFGEAKIKKKLNITDMNFEKNTTKQTLRGTELYMSPLLFNALRNTGEIDIKYNPYRSDVFSLGLCMLLAACLSYIPLYEIREIKKMDKIKNIIDGYLSKRYSKKFINLLLLMLQVNEKYRPDFIELKSWISNHYFEQ